MQGQDGSRLYGSGAIVPRLEATTGRIIDVVVPDEASPDLPGACSATEPDRTGGVQGARLPGLSGLSDVRAGDQRRGARATDTVIDCTMPTGQVTTVRDATGRRAGEARDADGGPDHPRPQPLNSDATIDSRCLNCSNQAVRLGCPARQSIVSLKRKSR